jgi:hypothetical protein
MKLIGCKMRVCFVRFFLTSNITFARYLNPLFNSNSVLSLIQMQFVTQYSFFRGLDITYPMERRSYLFELFVYYIWSQLGWYKRGSGMY